MARTLAVDFDGVIHPNTSTTPDTFAWEHIPDPPQDGAAEFLRRALERFDEVVIFTTRASDPKGHQAIREWFCRYDMGFVVERCAITHTKPAAQVYLDDRAVQFNGRWPDLNTLVQFKPWNRRRSNGDGRHRRAGWRRP